MNCSPSVDLFAQLWYTVNVHDHRILESIEIVDTKSKFTDWFQQLPTIHGYSSFLRFICQL